MSNAHLLAEAIDAAITLGRALAVMVCIVSTACALLLAVVAALVVRAVRRRVTGPSPRCGRLRARMFTRARLRRTRARTAPWTHSQPLHYEEAA